MAGAKRSDVTSRQTHVQHDLMDEKHLSLAFLQDPVKPQIVEYFQISIFGNMKFGQRLRFSMHLGQRALATRHNVRGWTWLGCLRSARREVRGVREVGGGLPAWSASHSASMVCPGSQALASWPSFPFLAVADPTWREVGRAGTSGGRAAMA